MKIRRKITLKLFYKILNKTRNSIKLLNHYCKLPSKKSYFILEEIDVERKNFCLRYRGKTTLIKLSFLDIFTHGDLLNKLHPVQACVLGGYVGRSLKTNDMKNIFKQKAGLGFKLRDSQNLCKMLYDNKDGTICFINKINNQVTTLDCRTLASDDSLISKFDPSQACYIGMLAGIAIHKYNSKLKTNTSNKKVPHLFLIK